MKFNALQQPKTEFGSILVRRGIARRAKRKETVVTFAGLETAKKGQLVG